MIDAFKSGVRDQIERYLKGSLSLSEWSDLLSTLKQYGHDESFQMLSNVQLQKPGACSTDRDFRLSKISKRGDTQVVLLRLKLIISFV